MVDVVYKVKRKCDHSEHICTSLSGLFQYFTEDDLGLKISALYTYRKKNMKPFDVIETPKVYIEVLPLYKSRNTTYVPALGAPELTGKVNVTDLVEMLSVKTQLVQDAEDRVYYMIDLIKKRTSHVKRQSDVIRGVEVGGISFGDAANYNEIFTLNDVERMREMGCYINRVGELCVRLILD